MAEQYKINGRLMVGKGASTNYIGEGTDVASLTKDEAKKYSIKSAEFEKLVASGVLTLGGAHAPAATQKAEPQPLSATDYLRFTKAVEGLDENDEKSWTSDKKPEVAALKEAGCVVTAAQRDEAWALFLAE